MSDVFNLPKLPKHYKEDWFTDASDPPTSMLMNRLYTERQVKEIQKETARKILMDSAGLCREMFGENTDFDGRDCYYTLLKVEIC